MVSQWARGATGGHGFGRQAGGRSGYDTRRHQSVLPASQPRRPGAWRRRPRPQRGALYVPCSDGGSGGAECTSPWGPCPPWSHGGTSVASAGAATTGADFCVPSVVVGGGAVRRRSSTGRRLGRSGGASAIGSTSLAARFTCGRARNGSSSISTCGLGMRGERGGRVPRRHLREVSRVSGDGDGDGEVRSPFESSPGGGRGAEMSRASASLGCIVQAPMGSPGQRSGSRSFWTIFQSPAAPRRRSHGRR